MRRALGAGVCGAGLVLAGVLGATDGSTVPPAEPGDGGSQAVQAATAGAPLPAGHPGPPANSRPGTGGAVQAGPVR